MSIITLPVVRVRNLRVDKIPMQFDPEDLVDDRIRPVNPVDDNGRPYTVLDLEEDGYVSWELEEEDMTGRKRHWLIAKSYKEVTSTREEFMISG